MLFIITYMLFAVGFNISVFKKKEINYIHIFQLSYEHKVSEWQLWKGGVILLFIWTMGFSMNFMEIVLQANKKENELLADGTYTPKKYVDWATLVVVVIFLILCI